MLRGEVGGDFLGGGRGDDVSHGGDGNDEFNLRGNSSVPAAEDDPGLDEYHGNAGDDTFYANPDGERDEVYCGDGVDRVFVAPEDFVADDCEPTPTN